MGRLAQATRNAKARLRSAAQDTKALRGKMQAEQMASSRAYLLKARRRLPRPPDVKGLLDEIKARWEPADPLKAGAGEGKQAKPSVSDSRNDKKELLREVIVQLKLFHKAAKQVVDQVKQGDEALQLLQRTSVAIVRAPIPNERFTTAQIDELLGLFLLFIALIEFYAKRLKG